jgi:nicotinamidase-related amidase
MKALLKLRDTALGAALLLSTMASSALAETPRAEYVRPITPENAAVLFIDNQSNLMLGVQSIDTTLLRINTEGLAKLSKIYGLPVVLTTTGGGANGPAGPLSSGITETYPDTPIIDRTDYFNAMSDPRFAEAVKRTGRKKVILSGLTTDYCLVYPAASLIAQGYHVFIVTDASGSWTKQIDETALQRLVQMGATPINLQSLVGELQNADAVKDLAASKRKQPQLMQWFSRYSPAPSIMNMTMAAQAKKR